jgi:hypothetical protein
MLDLEDFNLSKTISLDEADHRFQLIYATQLYSSLFGVFARFRTEKQSEEIVTIKQIDFIGINYKGPINLGIIDINVSHNNVDGLLEIDLTVRADNTPLYTDEFNKTNLNYGIRRGDVMRITRTILPMYEGSSTDVMDKAFVNGKFDSEFFERDGLYVKERPLSHDAQFNSTHLQRLPNLSNPTQKAVHELIGPTCRIGEAKFLFD